MNLVKIYIKDHQKYRKIAGLVFTFIWLDFCKKNIKLCWAYGIKFLLCFLHLFPASYFPPLFAKPYIYSQSILFSHSHPSLSLSLSLTNTRPLYPSKLSLIISFSNLIRLTNNLKIVKTFFYSQSSNFFWPPHLMPG